MKLRMRITAVVVAAAALTAGPVAAASAADASGGQTSSVGNVEMTVTAGSASTVTFDVSGGVRPVRLQDGSVGLSDGEAISNALPTSVDVGHGRTVSGTWSIDDSDTVTFHFTADDGKRRGEKSGADVRLNSDWGSDEWGHCVSGRGVANAIGAGVLGAIAGPGAVVAATGGMLAGIIGGALTC